MSRTSRYGMFVEHRLREQYDIPDDEEIDWDQFEGAPMPSVFEWFGSNLEDRLMFDGDAGERWDVFLSYASERRHELARPLKARLRDLGLSVWFDEEQYRSGAVDEAVNAAIPHIDVGVILVSEEYFRKEWTTYELNGLIMAGVRNLVFVAFMLTPDGEGAVEDIGRRLSGGRDVSVVPLRSDRTTGLGRRIGAAVRRSATSRTEAPTHDPAFIAWAVSRFEKAQPDPDQIRRIEHQKEQVEHQKEMDHLLDRVFDSDLDLMRDKLPEEAIDARLYPRPGDVG